MAVRNYTVNLVKSVGVSSHTYRHDNITRVKCPKCGKFLLQVRGKRGEMLVCQDRACGHREMTSQTTNAHCPECHKKLELRGEGEGKIFICSCGYREKLSAFSKRRETEKGSTDKREVQQFMAQQRAEAAPLNTALADALAKLKK